MGWPTVEDYLDKIYDGITSRHADAHIKIVISDTYAIPFGIKDDERDRRIVKNSHSVMFSP